MPHVANAAAAPSLDPVLAPYLRASGDEAERHLADLLAGDVDRVIRAIVGRTMGLSTGARQTGGPEVEDVRAEVVLQVLSRLRQLKTTEAGAPIENFLGYVSGIAYRTCYTHFRRLNPERARLASRLRRAFADDPGLSLVQEATGAWRASLAVWPSTPRPRSRLEEFRRQPSAFARGALAQVGPSRGSTPGAVKALLSEIGEPVALDELVDALSDLLASGTPDPTAGTVNIDELSDRLGDARPATDTILMRREYLAHLWAEVNELLPHQRAAVLLNLRDPDGRSALPALPLTGVATMRDIARTLGMPPGDLARIWRTLPLDDAMIAARLGVSRQQVINFRKSARERLSRRMDRFGTRPG